jgi:hypothetical protein
VIDDPFLTDDAAYVLGALTRADRHAYEQHLRGCATCAAAVREVADLPALLSSVGPEAFTSSIRCSAGSGPPATLLPRLLESARREHHLLRRLAAVTTLAMAACLVAIIIAVAAVHSHSPGQPASPKATVMTHVVAAPIDALARLTSNVWGTRIQLRCTYPAQPERWTSTYTLVVIDHAGHAQQAASWQSIPGVVSIIAASTDLTRAEIAQIEVRTTRGQPVLRLAL